MSWVVHNVSYSTAANLLWVSKFYPANKMTLTKVIIFLKDDLFQSVPHLAGKKCTNSSSLGLPFSTWIILEGIYSFCQGTALQKDNFQCAGPAITGNPQNWGFTPILSETSCSSSNSTFFKPECL